MVVCMCFMMELFVRFLIIGYFDGDDDVMVIIMDDLLFYFLIVLILVKVDIFL